MEALKNLPKPVQITGLVIGGLIVLGLCLSTYNELTAEERAADEAVEQIREQRERLRQFQPQSTP